MNYFCLKLKQLIILLFILFIQTHSLAQNIVINEFMASNSTTIADPDFNAYADWIEIYNAGNTTVNLKNYFITDDLSIPQKYQFTSDIIIEPDAYLIIWADEAATGNHVNFKLSASGESIGLFNSALAVIDTLSFGIQQKDVSLGRFPNGSNNWFSFFPSTPGTVNIEESIYNLLPNPSISYSGGFYETPITISITHTLPDVKIYYSTTGKIPDTLSNLYTIPIGIDSTTVLRIRAFKDGYTASITSTETYFINEQTDLPVFSIVTDPDNFFSDTSGIYVAGTNGISGHCSTQPRNWNQDWERPIHLEFFEKDKSLAFSLNAGVKIFSGCSRLYPMKSLAVFFRSEYGENKLRYKLFKDINVNEFDSFILRSSGQDWWRTMFRDAMVQTLIEHGMKLDYQDYRPAILFINGAYWGIHNIREKLNDHYVYYHHGADINNIDLIEISKGVVANNGDLVAYNDMINFLSTKNMAYPLNYDYIKSIIDLDEYIDYQAAQIYSANGDWPGANTKLWRERVSGSKWRWMIFDLDFTFGGNSQGLYSTNTLNQATATNGPDWPNPPWSTLMFRKMLENPEFKNEFIQRFAAHINTTFEPYHVLAVIDSMSEVIASEIPRHKLRWPQSISFGSSWQELIDIMREFALARPEAVRSHFYSKFGISGSSSLVISRNNPEWGKVFTNTVEVKNNGSTNNFFNNIPIVIKAMPMPGYRFVRWEGVSDLTSPVISFLLDYNSTLTAVFEPAELTVTSIVINEINYKSSSVFDTEDWIEFFNPKDTAVDISGWKFMDDSTNNNFIFPAGTLIGVRNYLILCRDTSKFKQFHPDENKTIGNINFGLNSNGEHIQLLSDAGNLVDDVTYSSSEPWSSLPNGNGPTLSLLNPQLDNSLPNNWNASDMYGTPGYLNDVYTKIDENNNFIPNEFILYQNYPNPFNPSTKISWQLPLSSYITLRVYDILGREIITLVNEAKPAGVYEVTWNATDLPSGVYIYTLLSGMQTQTRKMVLIK